MTTRRVLGFTISLLQLILIVSMFLPFANNYTAFEALKPLSFLMIGFSALGFLLGIIGAKVELNYISVGVSITELVTTLIAMITQGGQLSIGFGFIAIAVLTFFILIATFIHSFFAKGVSPKKGKKVTVVNGGQTQQAGMKTNSLNMNMPVNNYQSLPVNRVEKKKAPMDILLAGKDAPVPLGSTVIQGNNNTVKSHMAELGLQSINISADNLTGAAPASFGQPIAPGQMPQQQPQQVVQSPFGDPKPNPVPQPAVQPAGVMPQQIPNAPAQQPMPQPMPQQGMPKPDLLAGSSMSGQLDNSPYNQQPIQPGQGQFF